MNVVVYSLSVWRAFSCSGMGGEISTLYTGSPGVFESLADDYEVNDIYESVTIDELNQIGCEMFDLGYKWMEVINNRCVDKIDNIHVGDILGIGCPILMNALVRCLSAKLSDFFITQPQAISALQPAPL